MMKSFVATATLISLVPRLLALTINTPVNVVQCQPILLSWSDGQGPFFLSALPGGQPSAPALKTFPTQDQNQYTWKVDLPAGSSLTFALKDNSGTQAFTDIVTVQDSSDTSCLNTAVDESGSGGSAPASTAGNTTAASGATTAAGSGTTGIVTTTGGAAASNTGTGAVVSKTATSVSKTAVVTGASPTTSNAASKSKVGAYGLAGVMGLVGLAVL